MIDILIVALLVVLLGLDLRYILRKMKRKECIGCGSCSGNCAHCYGGCETHTVKTAK
ncbi:MAG: FeoB-associated Cys-rich membrane protein [Lachnospiraceae bacterium]|nr:FeoB-associated Cys-rich membrane protein [Lachnospiraceae bacterium]